MEKMNNRNELIKKGHRVSITCRCATIRIVSASGRGLYISLTTDISDAITRYPDGIER